MARVQCSHLLLFLALYLLVGNEIKQTPSGVVVRVGVVLLHRFTLFNCLKYKKERKKNKNKDR